MFYWELSKRNFKVAFQRFSDDGLIKLSLKTQNNVIHWNFISNNT